MRGIDVTTTPEQKLIAAPDDIQLRFAVSQERVVFTQDIDFLRINRQGFNHLGIVYCSQQTKSIGQIIQGIILIWELQTPEEMINHIEYL